MGKSAGVNVEVIVKHIEKASNSSKNDVKMMSKMISSIVEKYGKALDLKRAMNSICNCCLCVLLYLWGVTSHELYVKKNNWVESLHEINR